MSTRFTKATRAHLTGNTLNHGLSLKLGVVLPPAPAELGPKVPPIGILVIRFLKVRVECAEMREGARGAVAAEASLGEELELFMVGMTCYRARRANATRGVCRRRGRAGEAEIDCLANVSERIGALGELVRECERGLLEEGRLGLEHGRKRRRVGHDADDDQLVRWQGDQERRERKQRSRGWTGTRTARRVRPPR